MLHLPLYLFPIFPVNKSVVGTRIAKIDGDIVLNPTLTQLNDSTLDLFVAGTSTELLMIEMRSISSSEILETDIESFVKIHHINDISEDELVEAIGKAAENIMETNKTYEESFDFAKVDIFDVDLQTSNIEESLIAYVRENYIEQIKDAIKTMAQKREKLGTF